TLLAGDWYNELGSHLILTPDSKGGLTGMYDSAVGRAHYFYTLTGRFDTNPPQDDKDGNPYGVSVGWAVTWKNDTAGNSNSTSTWSGQYFAATKNVVERIITQWLLTQSTDRILIWDATNVGADTFVREKPTDSEIAKAMQLR
ncbi:hypothetical protein GALMADRAFT_25497, partial [Galerina marginata CBS 339.88]